MSTTDTQKVNNSVIGDIDKALIIVLSVGLLPLLFISFANDNDVNALLKLYLSGFLAVISISHFLLSRSWRIYMQRSNRYFALGVIIFVLLSIISFIVSSRDIGAILGGVGYRLGFLALVCAIAIGLSADQLINRKNLAVYYFGSLSMLLTSILYNFVIVDRPVRLFWPIFLSNNLALLLVVSFIIGIYLIKSSNWYIFIPGQLFILIGIILTQSRTALALVLVLAGAYFLIKNGSFLNSHNKKVVVWLSIAIAGLIAIGFLIFAPLRLRSATYLIKSIDYRLELQNRGMEMLFIRPLTGIGPDAIQHYFNNGHNYGNQVTLTLQNDFKFISTHNIYLDKFIEYGWIAGIVFCLLVGRALKLGLTQYDGVAELGVSLVVFIALCLYGLVDFFSIETMIIFWITLIYLNITTLTIDKKLNII